MRIPDRFKIFGQTISVVWDKELINEDSARGQAVYRCNEIRLQPSTEGHPISDDQLEKSFLHEVFHFMFYLLDYKVGKVSLRSDERLVDLLAHTLHQVLTSAEYDTGEK